MPSSQQHVKELLPFTRGQRFEDEIVPERHPPSKQLLILGFTPTLHLFCNLHVKAEEELSVL
jgi:hypothetical protein